MSEYIQVEDNPNLARDKNSRAVVNTNMAAYKAAVERSRAVQKNKDELRVDEDGTPDDGGDSQDDGTDTSTLSS